MERAAKKDAVDALNGVFKTTSVAVVAHYSGLTVAQMQKLRMQMKQAGASVKVSKNRLAKIALEGTDVVAIGSLLKGPTVIATSNDPVAAPKVAIEFAKTNEQFVILGGSMGKTALDQNGVKALAALPSLDQLRATIVGIIQAPGGVDVIDTASLQRVKTIPTKGTIHNAYVTPDGKYVVAGSIQRKTVNVIAWVWMKSRAASG